MKDSKSTLTSKLSILLGSLSIVAMLILFSIGANYLSTKILARIFNLTSDMQSMLSYSISFGCTILWAVIGCKFLFGFRNPNLKPEIRKVSPNLIVGGGILIIAMNTILSPLQELLPKTNMEHLEDYMQGGLWTMLTAVIIAPIMEEYLFRGVIQRNIQRIAGPIWGIILSSLLFGALHGTPQQMIAATATGLILGSIYYITDSLNTVIVIHIFNNGLSYLLFWIFGSVIGYESSLMENKTLYWTIYSSALLLILLSAFLLIRVVMKRRKVENSNIMSNNPESQTNQLT